MRVEQIDKPCYMAIFYQSSEPVVSMFGNESELETVLNKFMERFRFFNRIEVKRGAIPTTTAGVVTVIFDKEKIYFEVEENYGTQDQRRGVISIDRTVYDSIRSCFDRTLNYGGTK